MKIKPPYGLFMASGPVPSGAPITTTRDKTIPLAGVRCRCLLLDTVAEVQLTQRYKNTDTNPIEAVYVFPVDDRAAISGFTARVGDKLVHGVVQKKKEAREEYDDALSSGHGAYLMESQSNDTLSVRLGNVAPGSEAEIQLTYSVECDTEGRSVTVSLPTTIKERYTPHVPTDDGSLAAEEEKMEVDEPADDKSSAATVGEEKMDVDSGPGPSYSSDVAYGLTFSLEAFMSGQIVSASSSTHPVKVKNDPDNTHHCTVELAVKEVPMDKDLVVRVEHTAANQPSASIVPSPRDDDKSPALMVSFLPEFDEGLVEGDQFEAIFLVDRSGSMGGGARSPMEQCKAALQLFLRSLPEKSVFNIVGFGSSYSKLFPKSQAYNTQNLETATDHVKSISSNMGGTEIYTPLKELLRASPTKKGATKTIFLLTDGAVGNTSEIITEVKKNAKTSRVFTFGLGDNAGQALVRGVAHAGNGQPCFIRSGEALDEMIITQLGKALGPVLDQPEVDLGSLKVSKQAPSSSSLPPVFNGSLYTVVAFLSPDSPTEGEVTLWGKLCGKKQEYKIRVSPSLSDTWIGSRILHSLTAHRLIRDLEESGEMDGRRDWMEEVTKLSLHWQVLSSQTAFLAVEERTEIVEGAMQTVQVPLAPVVRSSRMYGSRSRRSMLCGGGGGGGGRGGMRTKSKMVVHGLRAGASRGGGRGGRGGGLLQTGMKSRSASSFDEYFSAARPSSASAMPTVLKMKKCAAPARPGSASFAAKSASAPTEKDTDSVQPVALLQNVNGSWPLSDRLAAAVGLSPEQLAQAQPTDDKSVSAELWATAVAIAFLRSKCSDRRAAFKLLEQKALKWMAKESSKDNTEKLIAAAMLLF